MRTVVILTMIFSGFGGLFFWEAAKRAPPPLVPLPLVVEPTPEAPPPRQQALREERLEPACAALIPLHTPKPPAEPGEWIYEHPQGGQSFAEWQSSHPVKVTPERGTLYVLPIGAFTPKQRAVLAKAIHFIELYYQVPVKILAGVGADVIPKEGRRLHPQTHQPQVWTEWILQKVLMPRRPADALALLGLTAEDLFPADSWNFVFGQATLEERVGVYSLHRYGDPQTQQYLLRTLKVAVHELGHMVSIEHCVAFECAMNGSNSLEESDRAQLEPCPVCLQKLEHATGMNLRRRFEQLRDFYAAEGFDDERLKMVRSLALLPP